jgi:trimethylamine--corrinoid protein Co-methyltransferase
MHVQALSETARARLHGAAEDLLESVGLRLDSPALRAQLETHGLPLLDGDRVSLPRAAVRSALERAPRRVCLGGRDGSGRSVQLDGTRTFAATDGCGSRAVDFDSGERRPSALRDIAASARLADALAEFHVYWTMVSAQDVPRSERVAREVLTALQNTHKPVQAIDVGQPSEARALVRIARELADSHAVEHAALSMLISVVSPLRLDPAGTEAALEFARAGLPVVACSMPMAGVTAPATAAGMLMLGHAEAMGLVTVIETFCPGAPVIYCLFPAFAHPRTGETHYADPRRGWAAAAAAELGRSLGPPCFTSAEIPALAVGPDLCSGGGLLETSTLLAYEQLVIGDEALRGLRDAAAGEEVDDESLALDVIRRVGPGGHFLAQQHTRRHVRRFRVPTFVEVGADAVPPSGGEEPGAASARARLEARRILERHAVEPLPAPVAARLERIVRESPAVAAS